ncbi:hypothetical protein F7725_016890 [Dissostichus mawsoni]|uniref:Uncharacterized protein n=1 Tax=Dissostichus mawsoni TaxID=36200 RepID=A0A7J5Z5V7_DISMA|nr:hypothetical protein F7725_016890 [Dissostichus mawsoni]
MQASHNTELKLIFFNPFSCFYFNAAMDGVLEGATSALPAIADFLLQSRQLLLLLPPLHRLPGHSFLSFLWIFESWVSELTLLGDVIALRFLIFLCETYGAVLLLITPLIAVESVTRLPWPHSVVTIRKACPKVDSIEKLCFVIEEEVNKDSKDRKALVSCCQLHLLPVSVGCCRPQCQFAMESGGSEGSCLFALNQLPCQMFAQHVQPHAKQRESPLGMAFLFFLLIVLTKSLGLIRRNLALHRHTERNRELTRMATVAAVNPGMVGLEPEQCVDPEKTESSCTVHRAYSWNSVQMSAYHHGDFVLISPECLSVERGQKHERTKRVTPCAFPLEEHVDSQYRSQSGWRQRGFPAQG